MTTEVDICNQALVGIGIQKTISSLAQDSLEAKACNALYVTLRDDLLRMAPWNCALDTMTLPLITAAPGTPENTSPATPLWQKGQPAPPWAYEYQYPVNCLRACWIVPQTATGFAGGVPITTAVTGGAPSFWQGPPVRFKIAIDQFYAVTGAGISAQGAGYNIGDIIATAPAAQGTAPFGAPAQWRVTDASGSQVHGVEVVNTLLGAELPQTGSFFNSSGIGLGTVTVTGSGVGAVITPQGIIGPGDQRVILTNQEFAILVYVKQVTDPNVWDPTFENAFQQLLGAQLAMVLLGPKQKSIANQLIQQANQKIQAARVVDGNESLTVNDVTPDWIRVRGIDFTEDYSGPYNTGFNWGGMWPGYN